MKVDIDKKKKTGEIPLILMGLAASAAFWVMEAVVHAFVLDTEGFIEALLYPDPNELWMRLLIVLIIVGSSFYAASIVARLKLSESALRKERDRAKSYFDVAGVIFVVLGSDGRVLDINKKGCEVLGRDKTRIIGRDWIADFVPAGMKGDVSAVFSDLISDRVDAAAYHENLIISDTLGERYIAWQNRPLADENGVIYATLSSGMDITERRRAEEALRYERDKTIGVFNAMEDGIYIVNEQYDIDYVNPVIEREFGPWKGIKCYRYFHDRTEICPWCPNKEVFKGNTVRWEWHSFKNGKTYDLIDTPLRNPDGSLSKIEIFRDITESIRIRNALRESEEKYRLMIEESNDMIWTLDPSGNVTFMNRRCEEASGYSLEELKGTPVDPYIIKEDLPIARQAFERVTAGEKVSYEARMRRRDDTVQIISINSVPIRKDGAIAGIVNFGRDITKERLATAELKERVSDLERFMKVTVDRELRMKELSDEIERLKVKKEVPSTGRS